MKSEAPPGSCEDHAAFAVTIDTRVAHLPADTTVEVRHGAGCERYSLASDRVWPCAEDDQVGVLFCVPEMMSDAGLVPLDAGNPAAPGSVRRLECEVWTDGAASLTVAGGGFEQVERQLEVETDECGGFHTVEVSLTLGDTDGGV